jgi:tRNA-specific 2-thiouridylase
LGIGGIKAKGDDMKALQARGLRGAGEHTPWFVARKDIPNNTLWVVQGHDHPWLLSPQLHATDVSWCAGQAPAPGTYAAKTRYRQADAPCSYLPLPMTEGQVNSEPGSELGFELDFTQDQWAVTPGQSAVLYDGEVCLGGGVIASRETVRT